MGWIGSDPERYSTYETRIKDVLKEESKKNGFKVYYIGKTEAYVG